MMEWNVNISSIQTADLRFSPAVLRANCLFRLQQPGFVAIDFITIQDGEMFRSNEPLRSVRSSVIPQYKVSLMFLKSGLFPHI